MKIFLTGASSGIGLAMANLFLARGHEVWGTSREASRLSARPGFHPLTMDLADPASVRQAFAAGLGEAEHFDVVINNAGSGHFGPTETMNPDLLRELTQTLYLSPATLCQLALADMLPRAGGLIINVTSLAVRLPIPYMAAYNSAKSALAAFTMTLQLELAESGVRIVDLQPGDIRTNFNAAVKNAGRRDAASDRLKNVWRSVDNNLQRAPGPEIVAEAIMRVIESGEPAPRLTVGGFFQAIMAPLAVRLLPQRASLRLIRKFYRI